MLLSILILAAATLAIFFSAVLVGKKKTTSADRVLSIWLLIVFTQLIIYLIEVHQIKYANIWVEISGALVFLDRKSTRLNSSHVRISYAVFCLKKKIIS